MYKLCAVAMGNRHDTILIINANRAPWATCEDTIQMCEQIDTLATRFERITVTNDFNLLKKRRTATGIIHDNLVEEALRQLLTEHGLIKTAVALTKQSALLDIVFVTNNFSNNTITNIPTVANPDHKAQLATFKLPAISCNKKSVSFVQHENVAKVLSQID